jgi:hypothetical protein
MLLAMSQFSSYAPALAYYVLVVFTLTANGQQSVADAGIFKEDGIQGRSDREDQEIACQSSGEGMLEMEVLYAGSAPNRFNIATTALGVSADAPEVHHINFANDELNQVVKRRRCFPIDSLYRFVVY